MLAWPLSALSIAVFAFILGCQVEESTSAATSDIFHPHLTKQLLLDLINIAEKELKVFIYPIPDHVEKYEDENPSDWQECKGREHELHFCIEELFPRYLQDVRDNFAMYPHLKTNFVVHDPEQANAFVIDHTWLVHNSCMKILCSWLVDDMSMSMNMSIHCVSFCVHVLHTPAYNMS